MQRLVDIDLSDVQGVYDGAEGDSPTTRSS
jgi:hypothetical protein